MKKIWEERSFQMALTDILRQYRGKRIYVLGLGVSNRPLVRLLCQADLDVTACDRSDRSSIEETARELESYGAKLRLGPGYLDGAEADLVFRTPVMLPTSPEVSLFARQGAEISSEMELFCKLCPAKLIAVTGSDGKTTTTTLIAEFLRAAGKRVFLGGNIGTPLLEHLDEMGPDDFAAVELSSFQLMNMTCRPFRAVVTNLAPNHLDLHSSMEEYVAAKKNIFLNMDKSGSLILNLDNAITRALAPEAPCALSYFSREDPSASFFFDGEQIFRRGVPILRRSDILLPGDHNAENYMAAMAAVEDLIPDEAISQVAKSFGGVEHRMELVRELRGVKYYNDSIASSPTRTIAGLRCFPEPVILIAGGYDKKLSFEELGREICRRVKVLILCGDTAPKLKKAVLSSCMEPPKILETDEFDDVVSLASREAKAGDNVLLSPAAAAFDRFKNFAVRGKHFKELVNLLPE